MLCIDNDMEVQANTQLNFNNKNQKCQRNKKSITFKICLIVDYKTINNFVTKI